MPRVSYEIQAKLLGPTRGRNSLSLLAWRCSRSVSVREVVERVTYQKAASVVFCTWEGVACLRHRLLQHAVCLLGGSTVGILI